MVKRKRPHGKFHRLSDEEKERADKIKAITGVKDHEIYNLGLDGAISEAYQKELAGHARDRTDFFSNEMDRHSERDAKREWRAVRCRRCGSKFQTLQPKGGVKCLHCSDPSARGKEIEELEKYVERPPKHEYGQGEEIPFNPDSIEDEHRQWKQDRANFCLEEMRRITDLREKKRLKYEDDRRAKTL